jgi:hypothetical protein
LGAALKKFGENISNYYPKTKKYQVIKFPTFLFVFENCRFALIDEIFPK